MMRVEFDVQGIPEALARPRAVKRGRFVGVYQEHSTWQGLVALRAMQVGREQAIRFEGPVKLTCEFRMRRTKGLPKRREIAHVVKPDVDNLCKSTVDGLVPALIADDRAIVELHAAKRYATAVQSPGCLVTIEVATAAEEAR